MPYDPVSRRWFLKACGIATISLPFFASAPELAADEPAGDPDPAQEPTRLIFLCTALGFVPNQWIVALGTGPGMGVNFNIKDTDGWFPIQDGPNYQLPAVHADLAPFREHISFIKGLRNAKYRANTHNGDDVFLTCADTFANPALEFSNTVSCDQVAARSTALRPAGVRHPFLALGTEPSWTRSGCLSWTDQGVPLMPMKSPAEVFDLLFGVEKLPLEVRIQRLKDKKSILDTTMGELQRLHRRLGTADQRKLDEAVSAVRDVESDIQTQQRWLTVPKPKTDLARPAEDMQGSVAAHATAMFDLIHAAFLTDSTRVVTYEIPIWTRDITTKGDKHSLNHSGGDVELAQAHRDLDKHLSKQIAHLLAKLDGSKSGDGESLLHHALGVFGSGCWGPIHGLYSLPILSFGHGGGRIAQGRTLAYPSASTPLANLWLTMLKAAGVTVDRFGDSTGTLDQLLKA